VTTTTITREGSLEEPCCNLCGSQDPIPLFRTTDTRYHLPGSFGIVRCRSCGLVYLNPRPSFLSISTYYPSCYQPYQALRETGLEVQLLQVFQALFENYNRFFRLSRRGRLLDLGCGNGEFIRQKTKEGYDTYGVEINSDVAEQGKREGLEVFCGTIEEAAFPDGFFQVVTLNHVLEHMYDPSGTLREIFRIMEDNGYLFIAAPNFNGFESKLFKNDWDCLDSPRHVYHFTPETITALLEKTGFHVRTIRFSPTPVILYNSCRNHLAPVKIGRIFRTHLVMGFFFPLTLIASILRKTSVMIIIAGKSNP
jgi:SAM-dependent methyltransferase